MFDIGQALAQTFRVWIRKIAPFMLIALIVHAPMILLYFAWVDRSEAAADTSQPYHLVSLVYGGFAGPLLTGIYTYAVIQELRGVRSTLGQTVSVALTCLFPVLVLSLLQGLGIAIGLLLLVVPGLMLMVMWIAVIPVLVVERRGVLASFGRSVQLTAGCRWRIFGLLLVAWVIWWVPSLGLLVLVEVGVSTFSEQSLARYIVDLGFEIGSGAFWGVLSAVIYNNLRQLKEGVTPDEIAQIFE